MSRVDNCLLSEPLLDGSSRFFVSGRSDSVLFAKCVWIAEWLSLHFPRIKPVCLPVDEEEWQETVSALQKRVGPFPRTDVICYTESGRIIGNASDFVEWTKRKYGARCLLTDEDAKAIAIESSKRTQTALQLRRERDEKRKLFEDYLTKKESTQKSFKKLAILLDDIVLVLQKNLAVLESVSSDSPPPEYIPIPSEEWKKQIEESIPLGIPSDIREQWLSMFDDVGVFTDLVNGEKQEMQVDSTSDDQSNVNDLIDLRTKGVHQGKELVNSALGMQGRVHKHLKDLQ